MDILELIKTRRSIRKYKSDPVDDNTLDELLESARWAPSWKNSQCWRLVVVKESAVKEELANTMVLPNSAYEALKQAPVVIVACAEMGKSGYVQGEAGTDKGDYWYMFDVALATQNLVLTAHSRGLATVYIGLFDAGKAADIIGLPSGFCVVTMLLLGYPDDAGRTPSRRELPETVSYEKFGSA